MTSFAITAMVLAMLGVLSVLAMGLINMVRGKDTTGVVANKLMWWRIYLQAGALVAFAIVVALAKSQG